MHTEHQELMIETWEWLRGYLPIFPGGEIATRFWESKVQNILEFHREIQEFGTYRDNRSGKDYYLLRDHRQLLVTLLEECDFPEPWKARKLGRITLALSEGRDWIREP